MSIKRWFYRQENENHTFLKHQINTDTRTFDNRLSCQHDCRFLAGL